MQRGMVDAPDARMAFRGAVSARADAAIVPKSSVIRGGFAQVGLVAPRISADRAGAVLTPARVKRGRPSLALLVRRQVEQILASEDFDAAPRSKDFLRYIVEEALAGTGVQTCALPICPPGKQEAV